MIHILECHCEGTRRVESVDIKASGSAHIFDFLRKATPRDLIATAACRLARWRPKRWFITSLKPPKHRAAIWPSRSAASRHLYQSPPPVIWRELRSNGWWVRHKRRLKGSLFVLSRQTWHGRPLLTAPVYPPITCFEHEVMSVCARRGWEKKKKHFLFNLQRRRYSPKHDADPSN